MVKDTQGPLKICSSRRLNGDDDSLASTEEFDDGRDNDVSELEVEEVVRWVLGV